MNPRVTLVAVLGMFLSSVQLFAAPPHVSWTRVIPAAHDVGGAHAVLIYTLGDNSELAAFTESLIEHANRGEVLSIDDATGSRQYVLGTPPNERTLHALQRRFPANAYLGISAFSCAPTPHRGSGSTLDEDGKRVTRTFEWVEARCSARLDVMRATDGKRLAAVPLEGSGGSAKTVELTNDDVHAAIQVAAHYMGVRAADAIAPRRVRETIELETAVPALEEVAAMLDAGRIDDAAAIWSAALRQHPHSAALEFNLAALSQSMGDAAAARQHLERALQLAPKEARYRRALEAFRRHERESAVKNRMPAQ